MKSYRWTIVVVLSFLAFSNARAFAGNELGNGGDVMVCKDGSDPETLELLDFYESKIIRNILFDLGGHDLTVLEKIDLALVRLRLFDERRATIYREWAFGFLENVRFFDDIDLPDIEDSGYIMKPQFCSIKQIAIQREPQTPFDKRYFVDKRLWDRLDDDNRAGLILHEVIYRDAIARGQLNSINTRFVTGLVASSVFSEMNQQEYDDVIMRTLFAEYRFIGEDNNSHKWLYRYFDRIQLTNADATQFCRSLPGYSDFADISSGGGLWSDNPIARFLLKDDGSSDWWWCKNGQYDSTPRCQYESYRIREKDSVESPEVSHPFICATLL